MILNNFDYCFYFDCLSHYVFVHAGFKRLNSDIEISAKNQIIIIWGVTSIATASVISGVKVGIRRLSELCFAVGKIIFRIQSFLFYKQPLDDCSSGEEFCYTLEIELN